MEIRYEETILRPAEAGFTFVEGMLILAAIAVVALGGWLVYQHEHSATTPAAAATGSSTSLTTKPPAKQAMTTFTDDSKTFTIAYPANWTNTERQPGEVPNTFPLLDPEIMYVTPHDAPNIANGSFGGAITPNSIIVTAFASGNDRSILNSYASGNEQTTPRSLTIDGYAALYQQSRQTLAATPPTYTDDVYVVTHDGVTLLFLFTQQQGGGQGSSEFNATSTVPAFMALVYSVKFLK